MKRVLALFAKAPRPGEVKTRLCPPLSAEQAAELYDAMLRDIVELHAGEVPFQRALWFAPSTERAYFRELAAGRWFLHEQRGPALAQRMALLFRTHAAAGCDRIVLRGTDSPTLPPERIDEAFAALDDHDLVLCPDRDGGYNAIGLRGPADGLFELEMSTASVLEQTLARADALGLRAVTLQPHHDVDTADDLALLFAGDSLHLAPRTARWLQSARSAGVISP